MEAFGRSLVLEPYLATVVLAGGCLRHAASDEQRGEWLPDLISGATTYAFAHVERGARFDLAHVTTRRAARAAAWVLDGAKAFVLHGDSAERLVVSAPHRRRWRCRWPGSRCSSSMRRRPASARRGYPTQDGLRAADVELRGVKHRRCESPARGRRPGDRLDGRSTKRSPRSVPRPSARWSVRTKSRSTT